MPSVLTTGNSCHVARKTDWVTLPGKVNFMAISSAVNERIGAIHRTMLSAMMQHRAVCAERRGPLSRAWCTDGP